LFQCSKSGKIDPILTQSGAGFASRCEKPGLLAGF
jgi:hypothetical protein